MSDEANHIYVSRTMFELLAHILDTCNPRNCYLPLAVIWVLAMNPTTLARIPTLKLVPAMIRATIANCEILKQYKEEEEAKGEAEEKAKAGPSLDADIAAGEDEAGSVLTTEHAQALRAWGPKLRPGGVLAGPRYEEAKPALVAFLAARGQPADAVVLQRTGTGEDWFVIKT